MNDTGIRIFNVLPNLLQHIRYDKNFQRLLLSKRVFPQGQLDTFRIKYNPVLAMLMELMHVDQNAYQNFLLALEETQQNYCLKLLQVKYRDVQTIVTDARPIVEDDDTLVRDPEDNNMSSPRGDEFQNADSSMVYRCNREGLHGLAIILNYCKFDDDPEKKMYRQGSERDVTKLKELFETLRYQVVIKVDLTFQETERELRAFRDHEAHAKADSTIVVVMSHGGDGIINDAKPAIEGNVGNYICTKEWKQIGHEQIFDYFNSHDCQKLAGKPKMFFIQACRGGNLDIWPQNYVTVNCAPIAQRAAEIKRKVSDTLVSYATTRGYVGYRNVSGSPYVQAIYNVFTEHARKHHVETLLKKVDQQVEKMTFYPPQSNNKPAKLTTSYECKGFNKKFYFNRKVPQAVLPTLTISHLLWQKGKTVWQLVNPVWRAFEWNCVLPLYLFPVYLLLLILLPFFDKFR